METSAKALGIDRLSVADRLILVEEIWDSIVEESDSLEVPQSHRDELDRRLSSRESDPLAGSSWEDVKARLMGGTEDAR